jgi:type IV secretion system protein VirB10
MMSEALALDETLPLVGEDRGNRGLWMGLGGIMLSGILLFTGLEANRRSNDAPVVPSPRDYAVATAPRAELLIPDTYGSMRQLTPDLASLSASPVPLTPQLAPVRLTRTRTPEDVASIAPQAPAPNYAPPPLQPSAPDPGRTAPGIVYDIAQAAVAAVTAATSATPQATKAMAVGGGDRTYFVSQGTLIYAVLETALDSTQSGQVRAMISTPVYNVLGTQILVPKGSKLFGEYKGDLGTGQNRAAIIWTRLIRPDGATISLDSPASDQLGRAGIKGSVDTHFGERLLGALLQSTIDFGVAVASRAVTNNNGVVVALPNAAQSSGSQLIQPPPKPTLKVRHGTRIAVFVARDLDFSAVE